MPLRVSQIRLPLAGDESQVLHRALQRAGLSEDEVASIEVVRQSMDRRRRQPEWVYTVDIHLKDEGTPARRPRLRLGRDVRWVKERPLLPPTPGEEALLHRPVVLGQGPAGLFAALVLARQGYSPLVVDRGSTMSHRVRQIEDFYREHVLDEESNYLFGEGGAGTFSDGKLTSRSKDPRARAVLDEFRRKSGMETVSYYYRPHLGSDRVRAVVARIRREIIELGGEFLYDCRVDALVHENQVLRGLKTSRGTITTGTLICAPGHSARDFYRTLLSQGIPMEAKAFQMGFRVEHPQDFVDERIYGGPSHEMGLPPADYRLAVQVEGKGVFSFCMCPGGEIIPAVHDARHFNTNGMSKFSRDTGFANSGIVTTLEPDEFSSGSDPMAGLLLQEEYESLAAELAGTTFKLPAQRLPDFMADRPSESIPPVSCRSGSVASNIGALVPCYVRDRVRRALSALDRQMPGFVSVEAIICGPEARSSAPVRLLRDPETLESTGWSGFYPVGEGAGYAGGIVSAAVDGWRAAESLIRRFRPLEKTV